MLKYSAALKLGYNVITCKVNFWPFVIALLVIDFIDDLYKMLQDCPKICLSRQHVLTGRCG
jgi:hypothetical protein